VALAVNDGNDGNEIGEGATDDQIRKEPEQREDFRRTG
jgi:hypothetical protein